MKYRESKPFSSGTEYADFLYFWCKTCKYYKVRDDGFPEFPENGGCPILDAMENARFDLSKFPVKEIIEERDEDGNVMYWHKCTRFNRKKGTERFNPIRVDSIRLERS